MDCLDIPEHLGSQEPLEMSDCPEWLESLEMKDSWDETDSQVFRESQDSLVLTVYPEGMDSLACPVPLEKTDILELQDRTPTDHPVQLDLTATPDLMECPVLPESVVKLVRQD